MGRHCVAGEKGPSSQVQAKGGTCVAGTKEKEDLLGAGTGAEGTRGGTAAVAGRPIRKVPLTQQSSRAEEASPASRTQKDTRRRRLRLLGSATEPPPAVAILPHR